jgi:glycosyltransferase involved in cell wall biosynthesis
VRVLVVVEQLRRAAPGGIGTYVRGLIGGLAKLDHGGPEVTLLASRAPAVTDPVAGMGPPVLCSRLPARLLTRAWGGGLVRAPSGFDLVHATSFAAPPPAPGSPLAMTVHDLAWRKVPDAFPPRGRRWHDAALVRAIRDAAALMVGTDEVGTELVDAGARPEQVRLVEPMRGCDHLPPGDVTGAAQFLGRLGVTGPYLLTVSTIEPRKNLGRLVEAYGRARSELPEPWPLVIVGPNGWGPSIPRGVPGAVLAGPVNDAVLAGLYQRARCVAYVPLLEGFGLPAVEAMASAVPVVASPMPSTGGAAFEVDPLDIEAIARGLIMAACDEKLRAQLVSAGLVRTKDLTWERVARAHVAVWETLR